MSHYDITQWADYARQVTSESAALEMKDHLEGCGRCGELMSTLQLVADDAAAEEHHAVPEYSVRSVKAFFGLNQGLNQPPSGYQ